MIGLLGLPAMAADWDHRVDSFENGIEGKVFETLTQATVVPANTSGKTNVCAGFGHTFNQTQQGYLRVTISTFRTDPETGDTTTEIQKKKGAVSNSRWLKCIVVDELLKEDVVVLEWELSDMPRGRGGDIQTTLHIGEGRLLLGSLISRESKTTVDVTAHRVNSGQKDIEGKVPDTLTQATAAPADTGNIVNLCAGFGHTFKSRDRGLLRVRFSTFRTDPETGKTKRTRTRISGRVEESQWIECIRVQKLRKDDVVLAEWEILEMPKGRGGDIQALIHLGKGKLKSSELISRPAPAPTPT
ncbi:MAG: hypothetical protein HKN91_10650, partial [Acidimicrobiia bacterium]|nr:hypothetical protein [Acidimicrobiia bacterium]